MPEIIRPRLDTINTVADMRRAFKGLPPVPTRESKNTEPPVFKFNRMLQLTQAGFQGIREEIQTLPFSINNFTATIPVIDTVYFAAAVFNADQTSSPLQAKVVAEVQEHVAELLTEPSVIDPTTLRTLLRTSSLHHALANYFTRHPDPSENLNQLKIQHYLTQYPEATLRRLGGTIDLNRTYNNEHDFTEALIHVINVSSHDSITATPTVLLEQEQPLEPTTIMPAIKKVDSPSPVAERPATHENQYPEIEAYIQGAEGISNNGDGTFWIIPQNSDVNPHYAPPINLLISYGESGITLISQSPDSQETHIKIPKDVADATGANVKKMMPIATALEKLLNKPEANTHLPTLVTEDDIAFHEYGHDVAKTFLEQAQHAPAIITESDTQQELSRLFFNPDLDPVTEITALKDNLMKIAYRVNLYPDQERHYLALLSGILSADLPQVPMTLLNRTLELQNTIAPWLLTLLQSSNEFTNNAFLRLYSKPGVAEALHAFSPRPSPAIGEREEKNAMYRQQMAEGLKDY